MVNWKIQPVLQGLLQVWMDITLVDPDISNQVGTTTSMV